MKAIKHFARTALLLVATALILLVATPAFSQSGATNVTVLRSTVADSTTVTGSAAYGLLYYNHQKQEWRLRDAAGTFNPRTPAVNLTGYLKGGIINNTPGSFTIIRPAVNNTQIFSIGENSKRYAIMSLSGTSVTVAGYDGSGNKSALSAEPDSLFISSGNGTDSTYLRLNATLWPGYAAKFNDRLAVYSLTNLTGGTTRTYTWPDFSGNVLVGGGSNYLTGHTFINGAGYGGGATGLYDFKLGSLFNKIRDFAIAGDGVVDIVTPGGSITIGSTTSTGTSLGVSAHGITANATGLKLFPAGTLSTGGMLYQNSSGYMVPFNPGTNGNTVVLAGGVPTYTTLALNSSNAVGSSVLGLTNGGLASALTDPAADKVIGWDDTDNTNGYWTLGSGLSYSHATHTISASSGGTVTSIATTSPITGGTITTTGTIGINNAAADGSTKGAVTGTAADFNDNGSGLWSIDYTNGQAASGSVKGFLTSADWTAFNGKQATGLSWLLASGGTLTGANTLTGTTTNVLTAKFDALATTRTNGAGWWLTNTTAAAAGAQQRSPSLVLEGQGWKTTATAASQSVKFLLDVLPVQGTGNPTGNFNIASSINAGAYTNIFGITDTGVATLTASGSTMAFDPSSGIINNSTSFSFRLANAVKASILSTGQFQITNGTSAGEFRILEPSGSGTDYTGFTAVAMAAPIVYSMPAAAPTFTQSTMVSNTSNAMSWIAGVSKLKGFAADVQNSGTGETDLFTYTTATNPLAATDDEIELSGAGKFTNAASSVTIKLYFAGTSVMTTGSFSLAGGANAFQFKLNIRRTGSTTAVADGWFQTTTSGLTQTTQTMTDMTSLTFSASNVIKVTGTSTVGTGDIVAKSGKVLFYSGNP